MANTSTEYLEDHMQFLTRITPQKKTGEAYLSDAIQGLHTFLTDVKSHLEDPETHNFTYQISPSLPAAAINKLTKFESADDNASSEIDPWSEDKLIFWERVGREPAVHSEAKIWLTEVEKLILHSETLERSTASIWENFETQLAEPAAAILAMTHITFVPYYTNLIRVWDLDHEVYQNEAIIEIIKRHGFCTEIENLLITRFAENPGQWGADILYYQKDALDAHYNGFTTSAFFRRLVTKCYDVAVSDWKKYVAKQKEKHVRDGGKPEEFIDTSKEPYLNWFSYLDGWIEPAQKIFDELEDARLNGK